MLSGRHSRRSGRRCLRASCGASECVVVPEMSASVVVVVAAAAPAAAVALRVSPCVAMAAPFVLRECAEVAGTVIVRAQWSGGRAALPSPLVMAGRHTE